MVRGFGPLASPLTEAVRLTLMGGTVFAIALLVAEWWLS